MQFALDFIGQHLWGMFILTLRESRLKLGDHKLISTAGERNLVTCITEGLNPKDLRIVDV